MGLAARFTFGIGAFALLFAGISTWALLNGAKTLNQETADTARLEMAKATGRIHAEEYQLPPEMAGKQYSAGSGIKVIVGSGDVAVGERKIPSKVFRVREASEEEGGLGRTLDLFAPAKGNSNPEQRFVVLVLLVTAGLVGVVILFASITARRVSLPLKTLTEDVLTISRGRLDHRIRTEDAVGEVAMLGWAVDRMLDDLVEGQETQRSLEKRQQEVETLREIRRNLRPMEIDPPKGFKVDTLLVESAGAGTGDFADALSDGEGRPTLVVGTTATRGMPGALLMAMTRAYLRVAILEGHSPAESADRTNLSLNRDLSRGLYASAMIARLEPSDGTVELVSSGHKSPAIRWDAEEGIFRKLQPNGIALGFDRGPIFRRSMETLSLQLKKGDALFLFSPSAFEETNPKAKPLGENGVYALGKIAVEEGMPAMEEKLKTFLGGQPRSDLAFAMCRAVETEEVGNET
jgi:serine phosphatase RsbU (regulator of sigma subunit)